MKYEYECWKCGQWHPTELTDWVDLQDFVELSGTKIRLADTKRIIVDGGA